MSFKKLSKNFLAKKHIQNLTFESKVLSIKGLKNLQYPSSRRNYFSNLDVLATSLATLSGSEPEINILAT